MQKINFSVLFFVSGLLMLVFSSILFASGHAGFGKTVITFSFYSFFLGTAFYLWKLKNEK